MRYWPDGGQKRITKLSYHFYHQGIARMTEIELAERLHRDLGALATDAEWSSESTTGQ